MTWETSLALLPGSQLAGGTVHWHSRPCQAEGHGGPCAFAWFTQLFPSSQDPLESLKETSWDSFMSQFVLAGAASQSPIRNIQHRVGPDVGNNWLALCSHFGFVSSFQFMPWREW